MRVLAASILISLSLLPSGARASSFLEFVGVGTVYDVSPGGDAAVGWFGPGGAPWRWTESGGVAPIDSPAGAVLNQPSGVSANGAVVVGTATASGTLAYRWSETGGLVFPVPVPTGTRGSRAGDVSADGNAIAGQYTADSIGTHAVRWSPSGFQDLGVLPGYGLSIGLGISDDGSTVVGNVGIGTGGQGFRWSDGTGMVGLGFLAADTFSGAYAASLDGTVAVGSSGSSQSRMEAVRWNGSAIESLVPVPWRDSDTISSAESVDASGSVIGGSFAFTGPGGQSPGRAFLWTPATGMQYVDAILDALGVDRHGLETSEVTGLSADGLTLVGTAIDGRSWLARLDAIPDVADVPEPGTALLLLAGTVGLATRRRAH